MSRSSPTAIEASVTSASGLPPENELGRSHGDRVAGAQLGALEPPAVDLGAVRRIEVDHPVRGALLSNLCVTACHVAVLDLDIDVLRTADHHSPLPTFQLLTVRTYSR